MDTNMFKEILEAQKDIMKNIFKHEDSLLSELERYENKINDLGKPNSSLDIAVSTVYKAHIKNIKYLLNNIHENKNSNSIEDGNITR